LNQQGGDGQLVGFVDSHLVPLFYSLKPAGNPVAVASPLQKIVEVQPVVRNCPQWPTSKQVLVFRTFPVQVYPERKTPN